MQIAALPLNLALAVASEPDPEVCDSCLKQKVAELCIGRCSIFPDRCGTPRGIYCVVGAIFACVIPLVSSNPLNPWWGPLAAAAPGCSIMIGAGLDHLCSAQHAEPTADASLALARVQTSTIFPQVSLNGEPPMTR